MACISARFEFMLTASMSSAMGFAISALFLSCKQLLAGCFAFTTKLSTFNHVLIVRKFRHFSLITTTRLLAKA